MKEQVLVSTNVNEPKTLSAAWPRVVCIGLVAIVFLLLQTIVYRIQSREFLRKLPNKPQHAAINTNAMFFLYFL